MGNFSQRYGYTSVDKAFQRESVTTELRTALWNVLKFCIWNLYGGRVNDTTNISWLVKRLWVHYFNKDLDELPEFYDYGRGSYDELKEYFFNCKCYEIYDFLEFIANDASDLIGVERRNTINHTLEKFNAAYRFVETKIVEITDETEIQSIEEALQYPQRPVREHLQAALEKLSNRDKPDYRNSIKESISAVEAACRILTGKKSATLGDALKKINNLHPVMKQAFDKLYGYTSDASGVRHSLIDESNITYADAKFMLVTCSAFLSYLNVTASEK